MKKFKLGFTLAEVLITLGIIGVVAAIVMPTVMTAHQYSIIGTRCAKMAQQAENSARSYAVMQDENITDGNFGTWFNDTFIFADRAANRLKDGTLLSIGGVAAAHGGSGYNAALHGAVVGSLVFTPRPDGLTAVIRDRQYTFSVTELGYVFPSAADACLQALVTNRYKMTKQFYDARCANV